jgi:uncharacterized protein
MTEKIYFHNSKKQKLCGILEENNSEKEQVVILVHGHGSSKNGTTSTEMAEELAKRGINVFRIDLDGCGESEGDISDQTVTSMAGDIVSAIKFVENKGYRNIDLLGASGGALSSMVAFLDCPIVRKLALKSPVFDYAQQRTLREGEDAIRKWKENGFTILKKKNGKEFRINYSVFEDYKKHIMYDKVKSITCSVLIIHGDADALVPIEQSKTAFPNFPNAKLIILQGADHDLGINGDRSLSNKLFADWLEGKELIVPEPHYIYQQ